MIRYVVLLQGCEAVGPFDDRTTAEAYVASDWQRAEMTVIELYAPADSADDRQQVKS